VNASCTLYHLVRADFLERVRRYSFLIVLGATVFLGHAVASGRLTVWLGTTHRGVYNSAWVGALTAMATLFFTLLVGFYIVKNALERDRRTGVGQIIATTPVTRFVYILGKALSNLAVFAVVMGILILAAVVAQLGRGEETHVELWPLISPFLLIWLPAMATVAAVAVLFETLPGLRGGLGNVVFFFLLMNLIFYPLLLVVERSISITLVDLTGYGLMRTVFATTLRDRIPDYDGLFQITLTPGSTLQPVRWEGIPWTPERILARLYWIGVAFGLLLMATAFFNRFDPARGPVRRYDLFRRVWDLLERWRERLRSTASSIVSKASSLFSVSARVHLAPPTATLMRFRFGRTLLAELRLMLKGHRWWWYAVAVWLIVSGLSSPSAAARQDVLPYAWLWPLLIWSAMGVREVRYDTDQLVFSAPHPLRCQLPATWLAGVTVAMLAGSGVAVRLALAGDRAALQAWTVGALFIPALALALGTWSGSSKLFEVGYTILWYIGPVEGIKALDFMGASVDSST
jgi:ABC-type transport system involved in multi-copper enzyme maturation permease subunit